MFRRLTTFTSRHCPVVDNLFTRAANLSNRAPLHNAKMPVKMRPATKADGPALGPVYLSAFNGNPVLMNCFPPSSPECRAFILESFPEELDDPNSQVLVVTDPDHEDPDLVIAWAKWVRPGAEEKADAHGDKAWPKEGNPEFAEEFFNGIGRRHAEIMQGIRHWHLELIVCSQEHQGKGAASPLLRWGCERADEDGVLAFLESMPKAKAVYEKYGFEGVDYMEFKAPDGAIVTQDFMVRKGRASEDYERALANVAKSK